MGVEPLSEAINYFSFANLKGALISISIGAILYIAFVRTLLCSAKKGYVNPHNKEWTIENKIFRPVLFTILPFIGGLVSRVFDVSVDILIFIINRLFCKSVKVPATFYLGKPAKAEDGTGTETSITKSLSYSLLLFGIGLVATLIYLLFAEFRV